MEASSPPTHNVYESAPLPLGETMCIRVINIRPSITQDDSDPIVCDFHILNVRSGQLVTGVAVSNNCSASLGTDDRGINSASEISSRVQYRALSYTWGDSPADQTIELAGMPFGIRKNLWDFLSLARRRGLDTYVWIDAICIDQDTIGERNHQVAMMGDVYSSAQSVIVWLGNCSEATAETLDAIFTEILKSNVRHPKKSRMPMLRPHQRLAVKDLCNRPYWSRAWVVQEYLLAAMIDIWYGSLRANSWLVQQAILWVKQSVVQYPTVRYAYSNARLEYLIPRHDNSTARHELSHSPAQKILNHRRDHDLTRSARSATHGLDKFFSLLLDFNDMHCADRKDRIYALLPLFSPGERQVLNISPDYDSSTTTLFFHIVSQLIYRFEVKWPLRAIDQLRNMLQPDFDNRDAQRNVLSLRKASTGQKLGTLASVQHHKCEGGDDIHPAFDVCGCRHCGKAPFMILGAVCTTEFSREDWKSWARALLDSLNPEDQEFGFQILHDDYLGETPKLLTGNHLEHLEHDVRKPFGPYERTAFDNSRFRLRASGPKGSPTGYRGRAARQGERERKRLNSRITRPLIPVRKCRAQYRHSAF